MFISCTHFGRNVPNKEARRQTDMASLCPTGKALCKVFLCDFFYNAATAMPFMHVLRIVIVSNENNEDYFRKRDIDHEKLHRYAVWGKCSQLRLIFPAFVNLVRLGAMHSSEYRVVYMHMQTYKADLEGME